MKKINYIFLGITALLGLASCDETKDDNPVFQKPTEFVLNTPAFADQYYELSETGVVELTCSQPNYGFGAITQYEVEVATAEDFADFRTITPIYPTQAKLEVRDFDISEAICSILGINDDNYDAANATIPVYFRAKASINGVEGSEITSNIIKLPTVRYFSAVKTAGVIYLVGAPTEWKEPSVNEAERYSNWELKEDADAIGSKIYKGVFNIPADKAQFRFYTELNKWDVGSIGVRENDGDNEDIELVDGQFEGPCVNGKGNWQIPDWTTDGQMTIVVNLNAMTVKFMAGNVVEPRYVYMVGNNAGWKEPNEGNAATYENWRLADTNESGIYTNTFTISTDLPDEGTLYCRFYEKLSGWGPANWAAAAKDGDNVEVTSGVELPTYTGEGCFQLNGAAGKTVTVTLNTNDDKVTFDVAE